MPMKLFGLTIGKQNPVEPLESKKEESFVAPDSFDGTYTLETGGVFGTLVDFTGSIRDENKLIEKYRNLAMFPEVDQAIEDIVNESIIMDKDLKPVKLDLEQTDLSDNIKNKIYTEYDGILRMLKFHNKGVDLFRRWYIDSKLYYHIVLDKDNPRKGIKELRAIDPIKIKKIRKVKKDQTPRGPNQVPLIQSVEEFYVYTDTDKNSTFSTPASGIKIAPDSICYAHSGVIDMSSKRVVGYLQKAIRSVNMLRQIEDAVVIYRISRAPERRIFYVDVGNLPKNKAEQYLRDIMNRYRNKLTYDANTGEIHDGRNHMHMLEDFWMPRREGGRGTEITTLDGGQNLGDMEDVEYLLKKVYRSLNIPISRMEAENGFNMGRSAEITRDEVKFQKFIGKLRNRFAELFIQLLRVQLILKGVMSEDDWKTIEPDIRFDFTADSYFAELKQVEIMKDRVDILAQMDEYVGKYYSVDWVRKNILQQSEDEITQIDIQIEKENAETGGDEMGMEDPMMQGQDPQQMQGQAQPQAQQGAY
jgi:hypothetical protein